MVVKNRINNVQIIERDIVKQILSKNPIMVEDLKEIGRVMRTLKEKMEDRQ